MKQVNRRALEWEEIELELTLAEVLADLDPGLLAVSAGELR